MNRISRSCQRPEMRLRVHHTDGSGAVECQIDVKRTPCKQADPVELLRRTPHTPGAATDPWRLLSWPKAPLLGLVAGSGVLAEQGATHGLQGCFDTEPQRIARCTLLQKHFSTVDPVDSSCFRRAGPCRLPTCIHKIEDQSR
jgi:hypothetical protein